MRKKSLRWFLLGGMWLLLGWSFACGEEKTPTWGEGRDGMPVIIDENDSLDTFWIASLGVDELKVVGPKAAHDTLVQAHFDDFSQYQVTVADRTTYTSACVIYLGNPVPVKRCRPEVACDAQNPCPDDFDCLGGQCYAARSPCPNELDCPEGLICEQDGFCASPQCRKKDTCATGFDCLEGDTLPLVVEQVIFGGLSDGEVVLAPDPQKNNRIQPKTLPERGFVAGAVQIDVKSGLQNLAFPAFADQIAAPSFPELVRIGDRKPAELPASPPIGIALERVDPLIVEWQAGSGDYVEVKIIPGADSNTPNNKLRCITFDDGGLEIPAEALRFLSQDKANAFRFRLERHNFVLHSIVEGGVTKAAALIDVSSSFEGPISR